MLLAHKISGAPSPNCGAHQTIKGNRTCVVLFRKPCGAQSTSDARANKPRGARNGSNCLPLILMTTRPERFRVQALECYAAAQKENDPKAREAYLELVRNWRELADEIERFEHTWLDRQGI